MKFDWTFLGISVFREICPVGSYLHLVAKLTYEHGLGFKSMNSLIRIKNLN
jgi:hypothetical protein